MELRLHGTAARLLTYLLGLGIVLAGVVAQSAPLRPPAVPLVTHDPYFSIWSAADKLTDANTTHWTGKPHRLGSLARIDAKTLRLMGTEPASAPPLPQTSLEVTPTRTIYTFEGEGVQVKLTFMTPALPDDLEVLSRPVTYLTWDCLATDGKEHEVALTFSASGEPAVNVPSQQVVSRTQECDGLAIAIVGAREQATLQKKGDDLRIDWGYFLVAQKKSGISSLELAACRAGQHEILQSDSSSGSELMHAVPAESFTCTMESGVARVGAKPVSRWLMLAYDDQYSIKYFSENLRPYWRRNGDDALELLKKAAADYESLQRRCEDFDAALMADLRKTGGEHYAQLCALAYRQTFAGNKVVSDSKGKPLMFPKENFSNGCIGTVDVLFPQAPFFLLLSPTLTKAMLLPILEYAASPRWRHAYAPHDLGTYPWATGQVYGGGEESDRDQMPVEETGNMLIILSALAQSDGGQLAGKYWPVLSQWADYLAKEGLDPANQLCTADMFGHLAHNADLSLKAVIALGGYAQLCQMRGETAAGQKYSAIARDYARQWQQMAKDDGRTRLAFDRPGTWGMKHNLIWDRILNLHLFPDAVGDEEIAWYLKAQGRYGLPCDSRTDTSLIDWAVWSIAPARNPADWERLFEPIYRYANETPARVPLSDWFITTDAKQKGFQARSVVGGIFIKMLDDKDVRNRWAGRGETVHGEWARLTFPVFRPVVPSSNSAQKTPAIWHYVFEQPGQGWNQPGYNDSSWKSGPAGFGTQGTPGAAVRTEWATADIWLRREFTLGNEKLNQPFFTIHHDEDAQVYLNGVLAADVSGWITSYGECPIQAAALAALKPGTNMMAVHCHQTTGGQYIDVGILDKPASPAAPNSR